MSTFVFIFNFYTDGAQYRKIVENGSFKIAEARIFSKPTTHEEMVR